MTAALEMRRIRRMSEPQSNKYAELLRRIDEAREKAGIPSERKLCMVADIGLDGIRTIKRGNEPGAAKLKKLAKALGVSADYLLEAAGDDTMPSRTPPMIEVEELDVRGGAGGDGAVSSEIVVDGGNLMEKITPVSHWRVPAQMAQPVTNAAPAHLKIITIVGNSMIPDFTPGQKVLVDTTDIRPSPPGVFVVWDGLSLVVKLIEYLPFSDPPAVRIMSKNADFAPYERTLDEAYIQGRVVGCWQWT